MDDASIRRVVLHVSVQIAALPKDARLTRCSMSIRSPHRRG